MKRQGVSPIWDEYSRPAIIGREVRKLLAAGEKLVDVVRILAILHDVSKGTVRRAIKASDGQVPFSS
jgi:hypothetical protein